MKAYTDINQSKKLAEILPLESADTWYWEFPTAPKYNNYEHPMFHKGSDITNIPCWSLAALLNYLREIDFFPSIETDEHGVTMSVCYFDDEEGELLHPMHDITTGADNFVDACVEMIIKLHEQNFI